MDSDKFENFERAFRDGVAGAVRTCHCGKCYYNPDGNWDFDDGEIERLEKDPNATPLEYACGDITIEGRAYVDGCDCWHNRAQEIIGFIDDHARKIAEYLTLEKRRKQALADEAPVVG